ncbi:MAG: LytTR family transcriptional regulator DNA-binding domain-containing protein [Flavobacteriales bacterium]|nr:LytTR family transcriptional regulator DNA-binding domain-containing protein [Flavobacteriales bacterium]MBK9599527.1 LytTR family transcriptional regulator DNA-binding domain-containing protein [Flavobacteriales bacterium]QQS71683.1 MAG: LytTR family transcriptional regulator DNA-binding domain-containing protein [Flavobacteriales bacterium]HQV40302.1 LytTR family DNA-binding domain-containing protein [Flavobacteriales bacterium]HQW33310.1 LytTR family DNA-binding domain-containing protein 
MSTLRYPLILRDRNGHQLFDARSILFIQAEDKFARITCTDGTETVVFHALKDLEVRLACGSRVGDLFFLRTHRSCIAALHHAVALHGRSGVNFREGVSLPIGKRIWQQMAELLGQIPRAL